MHTHISHDDLRSNDLCVLLCVGELLFVDSAPNRKQLRVCDLFPVPRDVHLSGVYVILPKMEREDEGLVLRLSSDQADEFDLVG